MSGVLCIIAAPASGGAESYVQDLCIHLRSLDWKPHIVFIDRAADLGRDLGYERRFLQRLDDYGVGYSFLGHECRTRPWLGAIRLRKIAQQNETVLIHSHLAYGNIFAAALPRTPLVYTHHSENARFSPTVYRYFRWRVTRWIGISRRCVAALERHSGAKVTLVRNAVDLTRFQSMGQPRAPEYLPIRAIAVGRIATQKNYELMANAVAAVNRDGKKRITVDIFGEGDLMIQRRCHEILAGAGSPHDVMSFHGASARIPAELSEHTLFLMSSDWEGLPIALIEATASGLPAIVTDVGGCREIVEECRSGIVVSPGDADAYAQALRDMIESPERIASMSESAAKHVSAFSIEIAAEAHDRLYREISR